MALAVNVNRTVDRDDIPGDDFLGRAAEAAASAAVDDARGFCGPREVAISVVGAAASRSVNAEWRGRDAPTNVLAFPSPEMPAPPDEPVPAGDIVICAEIVSDEAQAQGKTAAAHWAHMVVHGTLHLMGYDHMEEADAEAMEAAERRAMASLGFEDPYAMHGT